MKSYRRIALLALAAIVSCFSNPAYAAANDSSYNWNGLYLGGNVGWGWNDVNFAITEPLLTPAKETINKSNGAGFTGGAQVGYNYVLHDDLLMGAEADVSSGGFYNSIRGTGGGLRKDGVDMFGTARARLGYVRDTVLFYGTGGLAWVDSNMVRTQISGSLRRATLGTRETATTLGSGWVAGAGVEWGIAPHFIARLEYLHLDAGTQSFVFPLASQHINVDSVFDIARVGLNYKFN
jgi:opacity protein-like surface antigen